MRTSPQELFEAGAHIGHQRKRWNPKTRPYIFDHRGGVTVIDLVKTCDQIEKAYEVAKGIVAGGGDIWFIGTKKQAKEIVKEGASSVEMPFCVNRWLGGTLTNFQTIEKSLGKYKKFLHLEEAGEIAKMHKKEGAAIRRKMDRMRN
ncbi:MAG: 30S ribosomal protein S2, partial [Puniceicoccales bacterium]|nr:30S ribosomal protein S2 [Puniceicoccales bacterium]